MRLGSWRTEPRGVNDPSSHGTPESSGDNAWPTEIKLNRAEQVLSVTFSDGVQIALTAEFLRVESPSAEVQGHSAAQKKTIAGKRNVAIVEIEPVGRYAVRLRFDDGHDSGIYSWRVLYRMGQEQEQLWSAYLISLTELGQSRDT